jgi:hypothetical protein
MPSTAWHGYVMTDKVEGNQTFAETKAGRQTKYTMACQHRHESVTI